MSLEARSMHVWRSIRSEPPPTLHGTEARGGEGKEARGATLLLLLPVPVSVCCSGGTLVLGRGANCTFQELSLVTHKSATVRLRG
jgi:hypothetical protein